jgi:phage terminase large subunit-like protein
MVRRVERAGSGDGEHRRSAGSRSKVARRPKAAERQAAEEQVRRVDRDPGRAQRVIDFIERLTVPSGVGQGGPFKLRDWQQDFIRDIYEPHVDGRRLVRRAILSIARKNGKTALIAALVLAHLIGPEAVRNGEIYSAANEREQAAQVYKVAAQMVRAEPELSAVLRCIDSTKTISYYGNGSFYRAISAEAGSKHGHNPSVVIYDELAQAKRRNLYDVLDTSMGARLEPLFITISTQSNDPEHILSKLIDDALNAGDPTIACSLFAADDDGDIYDPVQWRKANPALGDFRDLADFKALAAKAKRWPGERPKFKNLYLNMRVSSAEQWIEEDVWKERRGDPTIAAGEAVYLGLDLSATKDLTALVMVSADVGSTRVQPFFWKPRDTLEEHSSRDFGTGNRRYNEWAEQGLLLVTDGGSVNKAAVALKVAELCNTYRVLGMAYDRWRIDDLLREFDGVGLTAFKDGEKGDGLRLVPWGQGFKDMAPALDAVQQEVDEKRLVHDHQILTWNMANAVADQDESDNRKLIKSGKKARFRIDGAVAMAMAVGLKSRDRNQPVPFDVEALVA